MLGVDLSNNVCNNERVENKQESEKQMKKNLINSILILQGQMPHYNGTLKKEELELIKPSKLKDLFYAMRLERERAV